LGPSGWGTMVGRAAMVFSSSSDFPPIGGEHDTQASGLPVTGSTWPVIHDA
jgi:hypothetical protein